MGASTTMRRAPERACPGAIVGALAGWLASGCGTTVSLDEDPPATTTGASSTGGSSTGASSSISTADGTSDGDAPRPDLPLPDLPPPFAACPAGCTVDLPLVWTWDAESPAMRRPGDDGGPIEPPDPMPTPTLSLAAMVRLPDGSFVVAEVQEGGSWLTRVHADGAFAWSIPLEPHCGCEVVDVALSPFGELLVLGEAAFEDGQTWLVVMSLDSPLDAPYVQSLSWEPLWGPPSRPPRVGSGLALADGSTAVLTIEVGLDGDVLPKDYFEVRYYVGGVPEGLRQLDTQLGVDAPRRPRGVALPDGQIAAALPGGAGTGDYLVWMAPWSDYVGAVEPLGWPIDALVPGLDGAVVVAGLERPERGQPVLHAAALPYEEPPAWRHAIDVPASASGLPAVAVDGSGRTVLALRSTREGSREPAVSLVRLEADGALGWSTVLPLPAADAPIPLALSLADEDLVLAAIVDEHLHLERREQGCQCE